MKLTILFDLDDTLLNNDMDSFIPPYLQALALSIPEIPASIIIQGILSATKVMQLNQDPSLTLENVFDHYFYSKIRCSKTSLLDKLNNFYEHEFIKLRNLTSPHPGAIEIVKHVLQKGHQIVIATNPLFPKTATMQRVEWAGLGPFISQIALISTFEFFHFSKPHITYISEILAQLGWQNNPAVMIGNSKEDDIIPATKFGLPTYHLIKNGEAEPISEDQFHIQGTMENILPWLERIEDIGSVLESANFESMIATIKSTPAAIQTLIIKRNNHFLNPIISDDNILKNIIRYLIDKDIQFNQIIDTFRKTGIFLNNSFPEIYDSNLKINNPDQDIISELDQFIMNRKILINNILITLPKENDSVLQVMKQFCFLDKNATRLVFKHLSII